MSASSLPVSCVDLFCGAGGLTHGLMKEGIDVTAGIDIDPACKYPYEQNNGAAKFLQQDVEKLTVEDLAAFYPDHNFKLLAGCAPCQPFSTYSQGRDTTGDKKWGLLKSFARLVKKVDPDLVTMENVPQLPQHEVFEKFLAAFKNYYVWYGVVDCRRYGIPQGRRRLVFLASKFGPISLIEPTHVKDSFVTVSDTIQRLPKLRAGEANEEDRLHVAAGLSDLNIRRIRQSKPGGTWQDWDRDLVASCHKKKAGKTFGSVYGRMRWDEPAPTMTTLCYGFGNGRFGHPEQDRALSLREAALFQTFPHDYQFVPNGAPVHFKTVGRLIGNAVPVRLGEVIAQSIRQHLAEWDLLPNAQETATTAN